VHTQIPLIWAYPLANPGYTMHVKGYMGCTGNGDIPTMCTYPITVYTGYVPYRGHPTAMYHHTGVGSQGGNLEGLCTQLRADTYRMPTRVTRGKSPYPIQGVG